MPNFLEAVRALSAEAIPAPWEVYESDDGKWGLVHRRASGMVRPVADFPGSGEGGSSASDASVDLVELLRNSAARLAAVLELAYSLSRCLDEDDQIALRTALTALNSEP